MHLQKSLLWRKDDKEDDDNKWKMHISNNGTAADAVTHNTCRAKEQSVRLRHIRKPTIISQVLRVLDNSREKLPFPLQEGRLKVPAQQRSPETKLQRKRHRFSVINQQGRKRKSSPQGNISEKVEAVNCKQMFAGKKVVLLRCQHNIQQRLSVPISLMLLPLHFLGLPGVIQIQLKEEENMCLYRFEPVGMVWLPR
ncbi:hypothetical protein ACTXT7_015278 [Hymenolepis weldensis]